MLEFDEDIIVLEKEPTIVPVLDIIRENLPKFMSSTANTDVDPQPLDSSELPIISPSLPEALGHLDNLTTFFQSMSISTLVFSYYFSNFRFPSYYVSSTGGAKTSPTH